MGLYNFQKRFVPFIRSGEKKHTIRAKRKHPDEPGDTLYLYTGLRTKKAKRIIPPVECVKVEEIRIELQLYKGKSVLCQGLKFPHVIIDGQDLSNDEKEALAHKDGFSSFHEMFKFWTEPKNRLPFEGHIIHWK